MGRLFTLTFLLSIKLESTLYSLYGIKKTIRNPDGFHFISE